MSGNHAHTVSPGGKHRRTLAIVLTLVVTFLVVEVLVGLWANSLSLVADAGHMATDALGVGMALAALTASSRASRNPRRTFGRYRLEIVAALANAVLLLGVSAVVAYQGIQRLQHAPEIEAGPMLIVAILGLAINVYSFRALHVGAKESLNIHGARLEVLADMIGSIGVIVASITILTTGWSQADALVSLGLAAFIAPRAVILARNALRILAQDAPIHIDVDALRADLEALPTVDEVHDLHVWTLTSGMDVATVHIVSGWREPRTVLSAATRVLEKYGLEHTTVQVEDPKSAGETCVSW